MILTDLLGLGTPEHSVAGVAQAHGWREKRKPNTYTGYLHGSGALDFLIQKSPSIRVKLLVYGVGGVLV